MKELNALKYLLTEDIYLIPEPEHRSTDTLMAEDPEETQPREASGQNKPVEKPELKFFGNKEGSVLILINNRNHELLDKEQDDLLQKILKAVNVSENDLLMINTALTQIDDATISSLKATKILQFYLDHGITGEEIEAYSPVIVNGKTKLISDPLDDLIQDLSKKKLLWNSLQKMFIKL